MKALAAVSLVALALFLTATPASACATCFGAEDSGLTKGMNSAILTLLVIVGVLKKA